MKNPYITHGKEDIKSDGIRAAIFPFAIISQGIDMDRKILKPEGYSLVERLKHHAEMSFFVVIQLGTYAYVGYTIYEVLK